MKKVYIGDSVYAEVKPAAIIGYELVLTTENGYPDDPRNRIVLGPSEWEGLMAYVASLKAKTEAE